MPTLVLRIGGMTCRHCVREVTARLRDVVGVDTVTADAGTSVVRLSGAMGVDDVLGALRDLSRPVQVLAQAAPEAAPKAAPKAAVEAAAEAAASAFEVGRLGR